MSNKVAIAGVGMAKFGELWDKNLRDLSLEAGMYAIFDAGIQLKWSYPAPVLGDYFSRVSICFATLENSST